jgi:hypothetical protein
LLGLLALVPSASTGGFPGHVGRMAFICSGGDRTESDEVCVADPDGTKLGYITWSYNQVEREPRWSADGRRLTFVADANGAYGDIAVIDADRRNLRALTHGHIDLDPTWSPDGGTIVFGRATQFIFGGPANVGELVAIGSDGTGERVLRRNDDGIAQPAWSPDGRKIAYVSNDLISGPGIYTMNPDGSDQQLVISGPARQPTWSPDGTKLAYVWYVDIWTANADGSGRTNVTRTDYSTTGISETAPAWSPDGTRLAFSRVAPAGSGSEFYVYTIAADGSDLRRLETTNPIGLPWTWDPDWQPCPAECPPAPGLQVNPPRTEQTIFLTVGPGSRIAATNARGRKIKRISGYLKTKFVLRDRSRRDNLHLRGGNINARTGIRFVGTKVLPPAALRIGRYAFYSDAHRGRLHGHFSVVG